MAFIDNVQRIKVEDFPREQQEIIQRLAETYNFFAENVVNVVNGQIDYDNLVNKSILTLDVLVGTNGLPLQQLSFNANVGLVGATVIRAVNTTNSLGFPTQAPFINFTSRGTGTYDINQISGLIAGNNYTLTIELTFQ